MSLKNKSLTLARVEDLTLGAFAFAPESTTLNHLVNIISTAGGKDKFLAVAQYTLKILAHYLSWRARLQHQAGRRLAPTSATAPSLIKFAGLISDARLVHDFTGLFATIRWLTSLERRQCTTRELRTIERLQAWSILLYWPLEHITYLLGHDLMSSELSLSISANATTLDPKPRQPTIKLDSGKLTRASMGLWGVYLVLQLVNLSEDSKQVAAQERLLNKSKAISADTERVKLSHRRKIITCEVIAQLCNLPLAAHWGSKDGLIKNNLVVDLLNLVSHLAGFRSLWLAATPPTLAKTASEIDEKAPAADTVTDPDINQPVGLEAGLDEI